MVSNLGNVPLSLEDLGKLFQQNPLAAEQAKVIALLRMLEEKDAEIAKLKGEPPDDPKPNRAARRRAGKA